MLQFIVRAKLGPLVEAAAAVVQGQAPKDSLKTDQGPGPAADAPAREDEPAAAAAAAAGGRQKRVGGRALTAALAAAGVGAKAPRDAALTRGKQAARGAVAEEGAESISESVGEVTAAEADPSLSEEEGWEARGVGEQQPVTGLAVAAAVHGACEAVHAQLQQRLAVLQPEAGAGSNSAESSLVLELLLQQLAEIEEVVADQLTTGGAKGSGFSLLMWCCPTAEGGAAAMAAVLEALKPLGDTLQTQGGPGAGIQAADCAAV